MDFKIAGIFGQFREIEKSGKSVKKLCKIIITKTAEMRSIIIILKAGIL